MAATAATLIATGKPDLYRGAVYVGRNPYQEKVAGSPFKDRPFVAEYVDFSDSKIPMLKTMDEIFAEAKNQVGPAHFCGEDGVVAMPHPARPDILIVGTSQVRDTDLDGAVIGPYLDYDQRKELEDRMFWTGQFEVGRINAEDPNGLPEAPTAAQIDAEWARRKEVSRITGEAVDAAFRGIAATLNTDEGSPYSYAMNVESFRSIRNALRLEIAEKVNEASTHHHWSAQVKASNTTAESGCSICECGNKYWEFDTCTICGTVHNPKNHS